VDRRWPASDTFRADAALITAASGIDTASNRYSVDFISDQHYILCIDRIGLVAPLVQGGGLLAFRREVAM